MRAEATYVMKGAPVRGEERAQHLEPGPAIGAKEKPRTSLLLCAASNRPLGRWLATAPTKQKRRGSVLPVHKRKALLARRNR